MSKKGILKRSSQLKTIFVLSKAMPKTFTGLLTGIRFCYSFIACEKSGISSQIANLTL